jgi:FemAB-related protein (PEP-CTERM system-associated)
MKDSATTTAIDDNSAAAWDAFVLDHPAAEYCHLFNWCKVIEEAYRHQPCYLAATAEEQHGPKTLALNGILPLFLFHPFLRRPRLVSIPFFDQAGFLTRDDETEGQLFRAAAHLLREKGCTNLEIRQPTPALHSVIDCPADLKERVATLKVSLKLRLAATPEAMLQGFKAKLRNQINKGLGNGLQVKVGGQELLEPFYDVFSRNMRDLGSPVHSRLFFEAIFKYFQDRACICLVTFQARPVAAGFMFRFKDEIKNPWASSLKEFRYLNSNMVLYWQMIRFACEQGMRYFDMGRSSRGASTYRFKMQWGPEERPLYWHSWYPENEKQGAETLVIPGWSRLPTTIANILGPLVRRNISL